MLSASSTEFAPKVASRLADKGVTGPAREAACTSGHFSEEEEDEVAVSYKDL